MPTSNGHSSVWIAYLPTYLLCMDTNAMSE